MLTTQQQGSLRRYDNYFGWLESEKGSPGTDAFIIEYTITRLVLV